MNNKEVEDKHNEMSKKMAEEYGGLMKKEAEFKCKAIGYLSIAEPPYNVGEVPEGFVRKLKEIFHTGVMMGSLGFHECEFCLNQGVKKQHNGFLPRDALSSSEKRLRDEKNKIDYWFPEMIFHYINVHQFKPPEEFIKFIMDFSDEIIARLNI